MDAVAFDIASVPTPCYVVDRTLVERNCRILRGVMDRTGCRILLAQKAFSMFSLYPLVGRYLSGTAASGLYEARLGFEEMGLENHVFSPAYTERDFPEILRYCGHIIFNSFTQLEHFGPRAAAAGRSCGLRINPECSTQGGGIYDPCAPGSRLGVRLSDFPGTLPPFLRGLHFHTLCEQNADALEATLDAFEQRFGKYLPGLDWVNFGGGHHITRRDYDIPRLERCVTRIRERYGVDVYLEPGEAVVLNAGFLVASVVDVLPGELAAVILDASATCHMPDVLEAPYRPRVIGAGESGEKPYSYRLGGPTCLAGDVIGDYSFDRPLFPGDRLVFCDMALYTMVKNNTFNGMPLPSILTCGADGKIETVKEFGYTDFKERLS